MTKTVTSGHITLHCADAREVEWPAADMVLTDPPWRYHQRFGGSAAANHYDGLSTREVAELLEAMPAPRLAMWLTWPLLGEWMRATERWKWGPPKTGGAWTKSRPNDSGHYGQGYHWAGCSELVLVYTRKGSSTDRSSPLRNAWIEQPSRHSGKPIGWQAQMIQRWTKPGGLVLDPFAGLGSVAAATSLAGGDRRFVGSEISPDRFRQSLAALGLAPCYA